MASSVWLSPPARLRGCRRLLALTVRPTDLLVAGGGLIQRLAADGAPVDVLFAVEGDPRRLGGADGYARLGLADVARHRLALRSPIDVSGSGDLLAALSELVGFDPEPGLFLLAPGAGAGAGAGGRAGDRAMAARAAERVAAIYHLPLLRYVADGSPDDAGLDRLELEPAEWARKRAALTVYGSELAARCTPTEAFLTTASQPVGPQAVA